MLTWEKIIQFCHSGNPPAERRILRTQSEWESLLSPEVFRITRLKGTERAFSSDMCSRFEPGRYACRCCGEILFDAAEKFESGSGWPSFSAPFKENSIAYHADYSFGMVRVEVTCNSCEAHLGHVFPDGPDPGGLRYCINALALEKSAAENTAG